jgi:putative endopeptidase
MRHTHCGLLPGLLAATLAVALVAGCSHPPQARKAVTPDTQGAFTARSDVVAANVDRSVNPGEDFFSYANGGWLRAHPIPAADSEYGIARLVQDDLDAKLRTVSERAAAHRNAAPGSDERKLGDFWVTALDQGLADRLGVAPIRADLAAIDAITDLNGVLDMAFALQHQSLGPLFSFGIGQDEKASDVMAVYLSQGGLGLPDRDYYFNKEDGIAKTRQAYVVHLANMLKLLGVKAPDAQARSRAVMALETALAKVSRPLEDLRDPERNYNRMSPAELTGRYTPAIAWTQRMRAWKLAPDYVIVGQPEFFSGLETLLPSTPVATLRDYLRLQLLDTYAPYLSKAFDDEHFDFYGRVLSGRQEQHPRWKRALGAENASLGMILGRIYVQQYFSPSAKARYSALVEAIRTAYGERIDRLDWMSPATKARARDKLARMTKKVGYPDKWKDYSALSVARSSYAENVRNAGIWLFNDQLSKFGKPVDRSEWDITPQTYNAYYSQANNEIVLPAAAFLVPGFEDAQLDDAVVYGYAAASLIGHEITHGFDDQGRKFDADGNLSDWWTREDAAQFEARAAVMIRQFDADEPLPGLHINGRATLGENIADLGGVLLGLDAFRKTGQYHDGARIAGYTPLQRFFLGYALSWLSEERPQLLRQYLLSDVHSPPKWRVNGPLSNVPEFYQAFGVRPGQPMYRPDSERVRIW